MAVEDRGLCRYCGADLVNWDRVRRQDVLDVEHTIKALKREYIRHHFWHKIRVLSVSWGMPPPQSRQLGGAGLGGSGRLVRNQGGETR